MAEKSPLLSERACRIWSRTIECCPLLRLFTHNTVTGLRTAPAACQIIASGRREAIAADGNIVEISVIGLTQPSRINGRIDEAKGFVAARDFLLVDESQVARPHGRRKTGSTILVGGAGSLVGTDVKGKVRVCRNVWAVAQGLGAVGTARGCFHLPAWNGKFVRRNAAATVGPGGFRHPRTARAVGL